MKRIIFLFLSIVLCSLTWAQEPLPPVSPSSATSLQAFPIYTLNTAPMSGATKTVVGGIGQAKYCYWAVVNYPIGSVVSHLGCVPNGPNTLTGGNYITISPFGYPQGFSTVDFLETPTDSAPSGACNCAVSTGVTSGSVNQTSNSLSSYTVPQFNPLSFVLTLSDEVVGSGSSHLILRQGWPWPGTQIADLSTSSGVTWANDLLGSTNTSQEVVGLLSHALPSLTTGFLNWTGSAWALSAGGANTALSNLASVSINTSLLAQTGVDLGSTTNPFRNLYLFGGGTYGTDSFEITGTSTANRTVTLPNNSGTVAELNLAQTFSAVQTISATNGLVLSAMTGTACLEEVSGVITSTGSGCGSITGVTAGTGLTGGGTSGTATLNVAFPNCITTVAGLSSCPAFASQNGWNATVTNGSNPSDCGVGGGAYLVPCAYSTALAAWTANPASLALGGSQFAIQTNNGSGGFTGINSPTTNGFYACGFNITASAPTALTCALQGVPNDATNPTTLLYSDRGSYLPWTGGSSLALPAISGQFGFNLAFALNNTTGTGLVQTANAAAGDLCGGSATCTVPSLFFQLMYQDQTSAPGHWYPVELPTYQAFGSTCNNGLNWSTASGFSCPSAPPLTTAIFMGGCNSTLPSGTQYCPVAGKAAIGTAPSESLVVPRAITITSMSVSTTVAEGAAATLQFTLGECTAAACGTVTTTAATCTVGNNASTCTATGLSVAVPANTVIVTQTIQTGTGSTGVSSVGYTYF